MGYGVQPIHACRAESKTKRKVTQPDWRNGGVVRVRAEKRDAAAFCRLLEKCLPRSARRNRWVSVLTDGAKIHTREASRQVAQICRRYGQHLTLRYLPGRSADCMPIEWLWKNWRDHVTHNHERLEIKALETDSDLYLDRVTHDPQPVLRLIGSHYAKWTHKQKN